MKYVYVHSIDGIPFYVGCGSKKRALFIDRPGEHINHIGERTVTINFIFQSEDEEAAYAEEIKLISKYREQGFKLLNKSSGGGSSNYGTELPAEIKKKISQTRNSEKFNSGANSIKCIELLPTGKVLYAGLNEYGVYEQKVFKTLKETIEYRNSMFKINSIYQPKDNQGAIELLLKKKKTILAAKKNFNE